LIAVVMPRVSEGPGGTGDAPPTRPGSSLTLGMTRLREGDRFRIFLASYLAFRLAVDFIKPEPRPILLGLTAIQWACVAGLIYYALVFSNDQRSAAVPLLRRSRVDLHDVLPQD